jgi:hypothetical protein
VSGLGGIPVLRSSEEGRFAVAQAEAWVAEELEAVQRAQYSVP